MIDYNYNEQHVEWMNKRCGKFTASEIHKLLEKGSKKEDYFGKGAMTYIRTKLAEILTGNVVEIAGVDAIEYGESNELEAVLAFESETGMKVNYMGKANPKFYQYSDYSGGSPDGLTEDDKAIIEIKCPYNSAEHVRYLFMECADDLKAERKEYYAQIQMNMLCSGKEYGYFISYDPRLSIPKLRLKIINVYKDEAFIEMLKERIAEAEKYLKVLYASLDEKELTTTLNA